MLVGENIFTTFTSLEVSSPSIESNSLFNSNNNSNSNSNDLILRSAPKLENNDLLLESLDLNLLNEFNDKSNSNNDNDDALIDSVFNNPNDPLFDNADENIEIADEDLKQMFDLVDSSINDNNNFDIVDETRSKSIPVIPSSKDINSTLSCKRSFSAANLDSLDNSSSSSSLSSNENKSKRDKLGCTPYTRKQRSVPLPPVIPKSGDLASVKRARNTEAARRSRARKMERMSQLENKCEILLKENEDLKAQVAALKKLLGQ